MKTQSDTVRHYVLERLENSTFEPGMRLPGSRKISEELTISRPVVQNALDTLVNEGVLRSVSRSGLYVDSAWQSRRPRNTLRVYTTDEFLPWMTMFREEISKRIPELHISQRCEEGDFEIVTTATAQTRHEEFADLMPLLKTCYPDFSPFCREQLKPFMQKDALTALPFLFSPRLMACNRKILEKAGCAVPSPDWTLNDFVALVEKLSGSSSVENVFLWNNSYYLWMNFILSAGGRLFCLDREDPVCFDSAESVAALKVFHSLKGNCSVQSGKDYISRCGSCAFSVIDSQIYGLNPEIFDRDFVFLPMPGVSPEHTGRSIQATELLVMRRRCIDSKLAVPLIEFLWSGKFQDHLAALHHGIPLRKSSIAKAFENCGKPYSTFQNVLEKLHSEYQLSSPDLFKLISSGISSILSGNEDIVPQVEELAFVVRKYLKYTRKL